MIEEAENQMINLTDKIHEEVKYFHVHYVSTLISKLDDE
jgi:hypothetical protein